VNSFFLTQLPVWHPFREERLPHLALAVPMGDGGDGAQVPLADGVAVDVCLSNDGEQETENRRIRRRFARVSVANVEGSARAPERLARNGESARVRGGE